MFFVCYIWVFQRGSQLSRSRSDKERNRERAIGLAFHPQPSNRPQGKSAVIIVKAQECKN
jgi:hypothetical protein